MHPQTQKHAAKLGQQNGSNCSTFYHLMGQLMSLAGLDELALMFPVCIHTCYPLHRHQKLRRPSSDLCTPSCDFPYGWWFSQESPQNLSWVTSDLILLCASQFRIRCRLSPARSQCTYWWFQLPGQTSPSLSHVNLWMLWSSPASLSQAVYHLVPWLRQGDHQDHL